MTRHDVQARRWTRQRRWRRRRGRPHGGGLVGRGDSTGTDRSGGWHVGLGDSTGSHRRGGCPVGLRCSLSDTAPRAGGRRTRSPSTRRPHVPDSPHEGCTEGGGSGEEEGAPAPPTDETQSYLDLHLDTCRVQYFVCSNYFMYFHIRLPIISHL
jgi:hypothetical protein